MKEIIATGEINNVYGIWGSHEFGAALAYLAAKSHKKKTVLVDFDILMPSIDVVMKVGKNPLRYEKNKSGMDLVYETISSGVFVPELVNEFCIKPYGLKNFHMLTAFSDIEQYEYIEIEFVKKLIDILRGQFDEVYILVNDNPYDAITAYVFSISKMIFRCRIPSALELRYYNNIAMLFNKKQDMSFSRFKFVADCSGMDFFNGKDLLECTFGGYIGNVSMNLFRDGSNSRRVSNEFLKVLEKAGICSFKRKGEVLLREKLASR